METLSKQLQSHVSYSCVPRSMNSTNRTHPGMDPVFVYLALCKSTEDRVSAAKVGGRIPRTRADPEARLTENVRTFSILMIGTML
jgi:hypothetical protein